MNKQQLSTLAKDFANLPELSCLSFGWDKNAPSQFGNKVPKDALIDNIRSLLSDSTFENVFGRSAIGVSFLNDFLQNYSQIINDISSEDFESFYYASYIYSSLLLLSLSLSLQLKTGSSEALGDKIERIDRGSISRLLFRGQSDSSWGILPSMFREVDYVGDIDYQWIVQRFQEHSLISEYRSFFKELDFSSNAEEIFAFFQHTICYSPLIDFSTSIKVAASFASNGINPKYREKDASILVLPDPYPYDDISFADAARKTKITLLGSKISIFSLVRGTPFYLIKKENLQPHFYYDKTPTNDKMWFQKGRLLYFYDCFILDGRILFPSNIHIDFENILIPSVEKQRLYERISKEPRYKQKYLNNPYRFFEDMHKRS